jgi:hypothetical protein
MKSAPKFGRKPQKFPLIPLFQMGKEYLLPFEKGGWEGFLGTPFKLLN